MSTAREKNRRSNVKSLLEKKTGKRYRELLSDEDKVIIMEQLLQCSYNEVMACKEGDMPTFIVVCALMLEDGRLPEYMDMLEKCRNKK